ncbi:class I SAM-dependent methyltransferase [Nocardia sp. NPDC051030]|uniref:class I SAM-dependent methyltransferase n=1 Tax=Nocardia sp. NPDC051030 TaxID=3155162 RepID=UPI003428A250
MSTIHWTEADTELSADWYSESSAPAPERIVLADDRTRADTAYRLACEGTTLLWRGDYHNARQLLQAMGRRIDRKAPPPQSDPRDAFLAQRKLRGHRARVLSRLVVVLDETHALTLRRAPDVRQAWMEAHDGPDRPVAVSLTELLGVIGAHGWRVEGVPIPALHARIHPHYGVFSPVRGEYVDLVANAPLPADTRIAFDLGTGTGVLAAVLASRGFERVIGTDISVRAVDCARDNAARLGFADRTQFLGPALYPEGRADLIVCNPPWIPARPTSTLEYGVYDAGGDMLQRFLDGLIEHLNPGGEGWLVLSDLAEHLGLRSREQLLEQIAAAGLRVVGKLDTAPQHPKASDASDPLYAARSAEVTSLWRLTPA